MSEQRMWLGCPHYESVSCRFSGTECFPDRKRDPCPFDDDLTAGYNLIAYGNTERVRNGE